LLGATAEQLVGRGTKEFLDGGADHYCAALLRKKQQPILEASHDLIEVFPKGAEDFAHATQLLADLADLRAHQAELIPPRDRLLVKFAGRDAIQLRRDLR